MAIQEVHSPSWHISMQTNSNFTYTHPIFIFECDISSIHTKISHCVFIAFFSCNVQGSFLKEKGTDQNCNVKLTLLLCTIVLPTNYCVCGISILNAGFEVVQSHEVTLFLFVILIFPISARNFTTGDRPLSAAMCRGVI